MKNLLVLICFLVSTIGFSQTLVTGKITDQNSEPLPGASISEKGTTTGVISDFNGNFEITVHLMKLCYPFHI